MGIIKNGNNVVALYKGATPLIKRYKGSNLIWQLVQDTNNILEFEFTGSSLKYKVNNVTYTAATSPFKTTVDDMIYCNDMFSGTSLTNIIQFPNTSNVTNMSYMFYYCSGLTSLDLSSWDTSNVTDMSNMFHGCSGLTSLDTSNWDTSNVTDMGSMFGSCSGLTSFEMTDKNAPNLTSTSYMFHNCGNLERVDLSGWNVPNLECTYNMFYYCDKLKSLNMSGWEFKGTFNSSKYNFDIFSKSLTELILDDVITSGVTDMQNMFSGLSGLTSLNVTSFDTSNVTDMRWMFGHCNGLTELNVGYFDTSNVTVMYCMFNGCKSLTSLDLGAFNTRQLTDITAMFRDCSSLTELTMSNFDTTNVTATTNAFMGCKALEEIEWEEFGKGYDFTSISFADCVKLGTNDGREMFRQTFIDRSYDRASAGLPTCTITLSSNTKSVLSQSEIAQMTKKGFTIA